MGLLCSLLILVSKGGHRIIDQFLFGISYKSMRIYVYFQPTPTDKRMDKYNRAKVTKTGHTKSLAILYYHVHVCRINNIHNSIFCHFAYTLNPNINRLTGGSDVPQRQNWPFRCIMAVIYFAATLISHLNNGFCTHAIDKIVNNYTLLPFLSIESELLLFSLLCMREQRV